MFHPVSSHSITKDFLFCFPKDQLVSSLFFGSEIIYTLSIITKLDTSSNRKKKEGSSFCDLNLH